MVESVKHLAVKKALQVFDLQGIKNSAEGRTRTDTSKIERGILSPLRLPIPPLRL